MLFSISIPFKLRLVPLVRSLAGLGMSWPIFCAIAATFAALRFSWQCCLAGRTNGGQSPWSYHAFTLFFMYWLEYVVEVAMKSLPWQQEEPPFLFDLERKEYLQNKEHPISMQFSILGEQWIHLADAVGILGTQQLDCPSCHSLKHRQAPWEVP